MKAPWLERYTQQFERLIQATSAPVLLHGHQVKGLYEWVMDFLSSVLCESVRQPTGLGGCGHCPACHMLQAGHHPDLRHLIPQAQALQMGFSVELKTGTKPSQDIRIDDVRALHDYFNTASSRGASRFVVVYPFDHLNLNTANALLKTLEEPPHGLRFILIGERADHLLPTIRSRCQQMYLPMPPVRESVQWLETQQVEQAEVVLTLAMNDPFEAHHLATQEPEQLELRKKWLTCLAQCETSLPTGLEKMGANALFDLAMCLCLDCVRVSQGLVPSHFAWLAPKLLWAKQVPVASFSQAYHALQTERQLANHPINPRLVLEFVRQQWQTLSV
jgi:DNA polymerase III subunit delta'